MSKVTKALQGKTAAELAEHIASLRTEIAEKSRARRMGELPNVRKVGQLRRELAAALTLQSQAAEEKEK